MSINWNNIRPLSTSQNDGFEELVCQLARKEKIPHASVFIRNGKPDGGVECFWVLKTQDEIGWQAKFFTSSIGDSQWKQIDESVKTVLLKHPNIIQYTIAIPNDPPDARISNKDTMFEKWNARVRKWEKWASKQGMTVEFSAWWASDLIERLQRPENVGFTYFWFHKEEFSDEWCKEQTELSIADLGRRYTPELNLDLDIAQIFNGLARDAIFEKQVESMFDAFLIKGKHIIPKEPIADISPSSFQDQFLWIENLFKTVKFMGIETLPINKFIQLLADTEQLISQLIDHYLDEEYKKKKESDGHRYYDKFGYEISKIREFQAFSEEVRDFLDSITMKLANFPFLLLEGDAGVGKSHLFADVIRKRTENGLGSLLFLGQHFVTREDPWTQIFNKNDIHCSVDEFLGALDAKAQLSNHRIIIFIDAVNEGQGRFFWGDNLNSFLLKIRKYEWLGLALSIRSTYSESIFPLDEVKEDKLLRYTHYGFQSNEYKAISLFFSYYGIELPSVPLLHPEFQNPLLLKLICEGLQKAKYTRIPDGFHGITTILNFLIDSINKALSRPNRLDYSKNLNITKIAINELIEYKLKNQHEYIPYEQALILLNQQSVKYGIRPGLLDELVSEGILAKNLFRDRENRYEEGVYIAYERFGDHLTAAFLIERSLNLQESLTENGDIFVYVENENKCRMHQGLLEAFSIQIPEKTGIEFYEYVPHVMKSYPIAESFVKSLLWRKHETISRKFMDYLNSVIFSYSRLIELFWDVVLSIASIPDNYLNAYFLHRNLWKFSMADRDSWWTLYLNKNFHEETSIKRLVDWAWDLGDRSYLVDEAVKLYSMTLSWFLVSTNRKLRDSTTKALICLLENRIQVLIELLKQFEGVNDPYIYERLFAVAYGCAIRTEQKSQLLDLSNYIFQIVFNKQDEIYPNILLRDYAREVIEYTSYCGFVMPFDISLIRPPYKSKWPSRFPSNEEIDSKYKLDYKAPDFKDYYWAQNSILNSMTTEYGRGTGGYGDFGRYVFQRALDFWDIDVNKVSNLAIEWVFEKCGYDKTKHGKFDREIGTGRPRTYSTIERIGKKYQWIAFYDILARVSDNCSMFEQSGIYKKEKEPYQGPWAPYVRDIDPTMVIHRTEYVDKEMYSVFWWWKDKFSNWTPDIKEWISIDTDLPNFKRLINLKDDANEDWLVLGGYPEWREPKGLGFDRWSKPFKRLWYSINTFLIPEGNFNDFKNWVISKEFDRSWIPDSSLRYEVFSREYYWSSAYKYFEKEYYNGIENHEIFDYLKQEKICKVSLTVNRFLWESEYDKSKDDTINFLKPSKHIFDKMELVFSEREGEFLNKQGDLICFDPSVNYDSLSFLLIKKNAFLEYLEVNKIKLLWLVQGGKSIMRGLSSPPTYEARQDIIGVYYLSSNNEIDGKQLTRMS